MQQAKEVLVARLARQRSELLGFVLWELDSVGIDTQGKMQCVAAVGEKLCVDMSGIPPLFFDLGDDVATMSAELPAMD